MIIKEPVNKIHTFSISPLIDQTLFPSSFRVLSASVLMLKVDQLGPSIFTPLDTFGNPITLRTGDFIAMGYLTGISIPFDGYPDGDINIGPLEWGLYNSTTTTYESLSSSASGVYKAVSLPLERYIHVGTNQTLIIKLDSINSYMSNLLAQIVLIVI